MLFCKLLNRVAIAAVFIASGCAAPSSEKAGAARPVALITTDYYFGSPFSGPTSQPSPKSATGPSTEPAAMSVHATFISLENVPATSFEPVGSRAIFFSSTGGNSAVLPAADLQRNATIADLKFPVDFPALLRKAKAGRFQTLAELSGSLQSGITTCFTVADPKAFIDPVSAVPFHRSVELSLASGSPGQMALGVSDFSAWRDGGFGRRTEKSIFILPAQDTTNTAIIVPFQFSESPIKAIGILIQISQGSDRSAEATAFNQASAHRDRSPAVLSSGGPSAASQTQAAVEALAPIAGRRSALVFLADQNGASVCEDFAMEADDVLLAQLVKSIRDRYPGQSSTGWLLDRCALELLAKLMADSANGGSKMPAELMTILTNHTGEVGRHSSSLADLLRGVLGEEDLHTRLTVQNTIFLEDSSPAARVRAFDWLNARHLAPAGYDPLASGRDRREALEKAASKS